MPVTSDTLPSRSTGIRFHWRTASDVMPRAVARETRPPAALTAALTARWVEVFMERSMTSFSCCRKWYLPKVPKTSLSCTFRAVDTIGKRIARHRLLKGWSRPELARRITQAINRATPLTGEAVRLYELDANNPGDDVRKGLALVFNKSEVYIEFGDSPPKAGNTDAEALWNAYLKAPEHERKMVDALLTRHMRKGK